MGQILLPQDHLHSSELKQVTGNLLSFIDADSVYISTGDNKPETKTIISVFVKKGSNQTSEELYNITEKLFQSYPQFTYRIFEADWAGYSFRKGNPFFMRHCSIQELAYSTENSNIFNPTQEHLKQLLKKAKTRYTKDSDETNVISRELSLYIRNGNHLQAAYILHQTIRRLYYTASWFLAGESIPSRSIAEQQAYIKPFSGVLGCLFDSEDTADTVLLEQLDSACEAVRSNMPVTINLETIPAAVLKAEWLQKEVQRFFEEATALCGTKFVSSPEEINSVESGRAEAPESKTESEKTLDDLQELATWHLKKLQPDVKLEGAFIAEVKFAGYADLMCFAADLIKLCVTAYVDSEENNYGRGEDSGLIVSPKVNIGNVLETVIQLLPFEEAEYLDILSEMFFEHQRKLKRS